MDPDLVRSIVLGLLPVAAFVVGVILGRRK